MTNSSLSLLFANSKTQTEATPKTEAKAKWEGAVPSVHTPFGYVYSKKGDDKNFDQVVVCVAREPIGVDWEEENHYNAKVILANPLDEDGNAITVEQANKWVADNKLSAIIADLKPLPLGEGDTFVEKLINSQLTDILVSIRHRVGSRLAFYLRVDDGKIYLVSSCWQNRRKPMNVG